MRGGGSISLILREPELADESAFLRAFRAAQGTVKNFAHFYLEGMSYLEWLGILRQKRAGIGVEPGFGPSTFLLAFSGAEIVGRVTLRHSVEERRLRRHGHIGYAVLPEHRGHGYSTEMLRLALPIASKVGLSRVALTCFADNFASLKTIERCGGVFESQSPDPDHSEPLKLYWIDLSAGVPSR